MRYKFPLFNQQHLGRLFGASSHEVGKWLVEAGLKDATTGKPSRDAHRGKFCDLAASGPTGWAWRPEKVVPLFLEAGQRLVIDPPEDLVESSPLNGPFTITVDQPKQIRNADGTPAMVASSSENAAFVLRLLNLAHERGVLGKVRPGDKGRTERNIPKESNEPQ